MLTIGFANKYYTLWDVSSETITDAYGRKGVRVSATYFKNISMDESTARAKYPDASVDFGLRGHSSWTRTEWEPMPSDVFPCGKYRGESIADCTDWDYLFYALDSWLLDNDESRSIAERALVAGGLYGIYDGEIMPTDRIAEIERADAAVDEIVEKIKETSVLEIASKTNVHVWDGEDMTSETERNNVLLTWSADMVRVQSYNGYDYGLPVKDGKAKRIKGKRMEIVVDGFDVEQRRSGRQLMVRVKDFTVLR